MQIESRAKSELSWSATGAFTFIEHMNGFSQMDSLYTPPSGGGGGTIGYAFVG